MNKFDENLITVFFEGSPFLGEQLSIKYKINDAVLQSTYRTNMRDFEYRLNIETEWILVEPADNKIIKIVKGNVMELDEAAFEKKIKVHATPKVEGMDYIGMPYQKDYTMIDLNPLKLADYVKGVPMDEKKKAEGEVVKLYTETAKHLHEYNQKVYSQYNFSFAIQNIDFWYHSYKDYNSLEIHKRMVKYGTEDRNHLRSKYDSLRTECDKLKTQLNDLDQENTRLRSQNDYLVEEKNFFMNCKFFKNTQEASFLDERSGEITNNILNFNSKDIIPNIPMVANQTFELTIMEDDVNQQKELLNEKADLESKVSEYDQLVKNYRKEIENYKKIYSQNRIDLIINENKKLKIKVNSLQNSIEEYKAKLLKFDFAYKYVINELGRVKKFSPLIGPKLPDENFLVASNIVQNLTKELFEKNQVIDNLQTKINTLKNELAHNQTF